MKPQPASKEKSPSLSFLQTEHRMKPDPDMAAIGCKEHGLNAGGIHPLISSLKSRFRLPGLDKVEEYLVLMEGQMKQLNQEKEDLEAKSKKTMDDLSEEIQKYKSENDYLERKHADAVVEKLRLEEALKDSKRQMEDLEEKANRLIEEKRVMKEEQSIMSEREKRCEERLRKVMEEIKKSEEYNSQLSSKNRELESEKRRSEDVADKYRKKYLALDSRLLDVERDVEVLQKHRPNVYHRMDGDSGLRTAATPSSEKEAANKRVKQMSSVEILASPGVGSSFHTPTQRIIGFHSEDIDSRRFQGEWLLQLPESDRHIRDLVRPEHLDEPSSFPDRYQVERIPRLKSDADYNLAAGSMKVSFEKEPQKRKMDQSAARPKKRAKKVGGPIVISKITCPGATLVATGSSWSSSGASDDAGALHHRSRRALTEGEVTNKAGAGSATGETLLGSADRLVSLEASLEVLLQGKTLPESACGPSAPQEPHLMPWDQSPLVKQVMHTYADSLESRACLSEADTLVKDLPPEELHAVMFAAASYAGNHWREHREAVTALKVDRSRLATHVAALEASLGEVQRQVESLTRELKEEQELRNREAEVIKARVSRELHGAFGKEKALLWAKHREELDDMEAKHRDKVRSLEVRHAEVLEAEYKRMSDESDRLIRESVKAALAQYGCDVEFEDCIDVEMAALAEEDEVGTPAVMIVDGEDHEPSLPDANSPDANPQES